MENSVSYIINSRISELGLSNLEIAGKIGVTEGTVRNIRKGEIGSRSFDIIASLCNFLDIPIELLVTVEKSKLVTAEDLRFLSLFKNADDRARSDALLFLNSHQLSQSEPSLMETARSMIDKAKSNGGILHPDSKKIAP